MSSRTISNSASELLLENRLRKSFSVQNEDAAINIFLKQEKPGQNTVSSTDHDVRLGPGDGVGLSSVQDGEEAIRARWTIIAASGTPRIALFETEDIRR